MLANVLPGIREIRAPLAAGYLWLLCGWLIFDLPSGNELDGPVREVVELAQRVPDSAVAIALSFAAYLIGSLSEDLFTRLLRTLPAARQLSVEPVSRRQDLSGPAAATPSGEAASPIATNITSAQNPEGELRESTSLPPTRAHLQDQLGSPPVPAQQAIEQGAVQQEIARLGNSIERLESEDTLRLALLPPLAVLATYLMIAQNLLWGLTLVCVPAFLAQIKSRQGRISRETATREELIQTAKLAAARALAFGRPQSVDKARVRVLMRVARTDLADARQEIEGLLDSRNWPTGTAKSWAQTWETSRIELARELSDDEWAKLSRAYVGMAALQTGLNAEAREVTDDDRDFLISTMAAIAEAEHVLKEDWK